jgi:hypothetical protein
MEEENNQDEQKQGKMTVVLNKNAATTSSGR